MIGVFWNTEHGRINSDRFCVTRSETSTFQKFKTQLHNLVCRCQVTTPQIPCHPNWQILPLGILLPHTTHEMTQPASQLFSPLGGYFLPPTSTLGSQVQRSFSGMLSITEGIWLPQPHQELLPAVAISHGEYRAMDARVLLTAVGACNLHAHIGELCRW